MARQPREIRGFYSKIAGLSHDGRQQHVADLKIGDRLILKREPKNKADSRAVAVIGGKGQHLGYLPAHTAFDVSRLLDDGVRGVAYIVQFTGDDEYPGVNLYVVLATRSTPEAAIRRLVKEKTGLKPRRSRGRGCLLVAIALILAFIIMGVLAR